MTGKYGNRRQLGMSGEEAAVKHLLSKGYIILERNWRCRIGEIDLIATTGDMLIVVEVRTRSSVRFGSGAESVDARKQHKLRRLAQAYMRERRLLDQAMRFDVVSIAMNASKVAVIEHIEHAF